MDKKFCVHTVFSFLVLHLMKRKTEIEMLYTVILFHCIEQKSVK